MLEQTLAASGAPPQSTTLTQWLAVVSVSLGAFASVTTEFLPVGLLPSIANDLGLTSGQAGYTITIPAIAAAIAAPGVTVGSGRLDRRSLMLILTTLLLASNVVTASAPNFTLLLFGRLLLGVSLGGFWSIAASLAARLVTERSAPKALSIILAGISLGTILGVPAGVAISSSLGWRSTFWLVGAIAFALILLQVAVLPALPSARGVKPADLVRLFSLRAIRSGFLATLFMVTGQFAAYTYISPFLKEKTQVSPELLSGILLAYGLAGLVGNFAASVTTPRNLRSTFIAVLIGISGSAALLPILGLTTPGAAVLLLIWGIAFGAMPMCVQTWTFRAAPHAPEGATAVLVTIFQICIATGSRLGGVIVDHVSLSAVMWTGGAIAALAIPTLLLSQEPKAIPGSAPPPAH